MKARNLLITLSTTLMLLFASYGYASVGSSTAEWKYWRTVGQAQLSVLFFDIYQSRLLTPTGVYEQTDDITPHPLALSIHYQRDVSRSQLIDATEEQWEKLGYSQSRRKQWLFQLEGIFPDIKKGQRLAYVTDGQTGHFYYQGSGGVEQIGVIEDESLNDAFLAIWLSPQTQYPKLRNQLIGEK